MRTPPEVEPQWDVFISHASEDKASFVAPLAAALQRFGLRVWYDEFTLKIGDSLSRSIDQGLAKSRFGIVVLSPSFIAKDWPEYELRGLTAREIGAGKVILPVWHNIARADVLAFSPPLADKLAVNTTGLSPVEVAVRVIEVVEPSLFERIHRRLAFLEAVDSAEIRQVEVTRLIEAPFRHENLSDDQLRRIRLIRAALIDVRPLTMREWVDGFRRDLHPGDEIRIWERIAASYLEFCSYAQPSHIQRGYVYRALFLLSVGAPREDYEGALSGFPELDFGPFTVAAS